MAVAHYQFEAIHPFEDGNGRTGRILNLLFLVEPGLLAQPVLYLSRAIIRTRPTTIPAAPGRHDEGPVGALGALHAEGRGGDGGVDDRQDPRDARAAPLGHEHVRTAAPKIYTRELVDAIFEQPYCRIANLVQAGIAKRQTASIYLGKLANLGVLVPIRSAVRDSSFIACSSTFWRPRTMRRDFRRRRSVSLSCRMPLTSEHGTGGPL